MRFIVLWKGWSNRYCLQDCRLRLLRGLCVGWPNTIETLEIVSFFIMILAICAVIASPGIFLEPEGRRIEISLLVLNKAIECAHSLMKRRGYPVSFANGDAFVFAVSVAIVSFVYYDERKAFRSHYLSAIDMLLA